MSERMIIFASEECGMLHACKAMDGKWKIPTIYILCENGTLRYSQIKKALGNVTGVMLSNTLKELEAEGLIIRTQYNTIPPRVDYTATDLARQLAPALKQMAQWGMIYWHSQQNEDQTQ